MTRTIGIKVFHEKEHDKIFFLFVSGKVIFLPIKGGRTYPGILMEVLLEYPVALPSISDTSLASEKGTEGKTKAMGWSPLKTEGLCSFTRRLPLPPKIFEPLQTTDRLDTKLRGVGVVKGWGGCRHKFGTTKNKTVWRRWGSCWEELQKIVFPNEGSIISPPSKPMILYLYALPKIFYRLRPLWH